MTNAINPVAAISILHLAYGKVKNLDPVCYEKLCEKLDMLDQDELRILSEAGIKWVSALAYNRLDLELAA